MDHRVVQVPASLVLDPGLTASAKLVWMVMRLNRSADTATLAALAGLARSTVPRASAQARMAARPSGGPRVRVPSALLAEPTIGAQAKVVYALLQTTAEFRGRYGRFTYGTLATAAGLSPNTLKAAVAELVGGGWLQVSQKSRVSPIHFTLTSPSLLSGQDEVELARRRLKRLRFSGEALMQEWLSLLIDSDYYTDNARPGFLISPLSHERLELDRFYPSDLAFEFHGDQHDHATRDYTQAKVDSQHLRDLIKAGICVYEGIRLVIIRREDLSLAGMLRRIGPNVPLRDRTGHELLIDFLEDSCIRYCAAPPIAD